MIVRTSVRWRMLLSRSWRKLLLMLAYSAVFVIAWEVGGVDVAIPTGIPAMLGTAISILLGFRTNSAYERWWEARKIWGGIVNDSRTFTRQVLTLPHASDAEAQARLTALQEELAHRQIGWNWTLNRALRGTDPLPGLAGLVPESEVPALREQQNRPNALLQTQAERIRAARLEGLLDPWLSLPIEATLARFSDHMGKCERIKNTPFPTTYSYIVSRIVWLFFLLLPPGLVQYLGWLTIPVSLAVAFAFVLIELTASYLQDPFENRITDTPMDAICRTIEINLRQQLGETDLPPKVEPTDGVLL